MNTMYTIKIDYSNILNFIGNSVLEISTLGNNAITVKFSVDSTSDSKVLQITTQGGTSYTLIEDHFNRIMNRFNGRPIGEKWVGSSYTAGHEPFNWNSTKDNPSASNPSTVKSPYVVALIKYILLMHT